MTESVTLLRPHMRNTCFAVVQCGNLWKLRLLIDDMTVRQEIIPGSFAEALIETVRGRRDRSGRDWHAVAG
jgi:hypothetical protein